MHKDPEMVWEETFPYDALKNAGITPHSSMKDIQEAIKYFMKHEPSRRQEARSGWDQLRKEGNRLLIDFFLYRLDILPDMEAKKHVKP